MTTPDALVNWQTEDFFPGIMDVLFKFSSDPNNRIVVITQSGKGKEKIPPSFNPIHIKGELRGSPKLLMMIKNHLHFDTQDIIVLGCKDKDVQQAANSKLLLLRADYARINNPNSKIYENEYGIGIADDSKLALFFDTFKSFVGGWYFKLKISDKTVIYALTDANTKNKPLNDTVLNDRFKRCLKDGHSSYRFPFMVYFLVSTYIIVKEFEQVDYWGIYPSSGLEHNEDLQYFMDKARQSYKGLCKEPILIRRRPVAKRHLKSKAMRISEACDRQLETITINPYYRNKLKGKSVCIIDDFTTYGTSCETARTLLEAAGVRRLIFICLGKFGKEFYSFSYKLKGDIYSDFTYLQNSHKQLFGNFNYEANFEFIKALRKLM
jgi:hypothetical protein